MAYRIVSGDTLSQIAARYRTSVSALMKANPYIKNANLIYAGRTLRIPGASDSYSAPKSNASKKSGGSSIISTIKGKLSSAAEHLANVARNVASKMNSRGWCARGVMNALEAAGMAVPRVPSAWMAASKLAADPRFKEVHLTDEQIKKLPPGAIIVSGAYNSPGNPHGHIAVTLGNGKEASDHIANVRTNGTQRVFIPV
jgi:murein DD-endopeptidase MepM/ murein hydrolase activator NlpD